MTDYNDPEKQATTTLVTRCVNLETRVVSHDEEDIVLGVEPGYITHKKDFSPEHTRVGVGETRIEAIEDWLQQVKEDVK